MKSTGFSAQMRILFVTDTPNPFVLSKSAPERSKQLSEEIAQRTGQNTRKEMDKRLGVSNSVTYIKCPHCGKTF